MPKGSSAGFTPVRRDRLLRERRHDTYRADGKLKEPTVCPRCKAVYRAGIWRWGQAPADSHETTCPACHRIEDDYPAGVVWLSGQFLARHREEILGLARNEESDKKREHALERIMRIDSRDNEIIITTTDIHLARRIGEAVEHAYAGDLEYHYQEDEHHLRVHWKRDE